MNDEWILSMKPKFKAEWTALPKEEMFAVHKKLDLLIQDPTPDGKAKKWLHSCEGTPCRLRCGNYRIIYTFKKPYVSLLTVRDRRDAYKGKILGEDLGGLDGSYKSNPPPKPGWTQALDQPAAPAPNKTQLPHPVSAEMLRNLGIPKTFDKDLVGIATEEELIDCATVPDELLERVIDAAVNASLEVIVRQPDLVIPEVDDLIRYKEGELLGFLLKLNPIQEKIVKRGVKGKGPTLLKGAAGTGKSTVAMYRTRELLAYLKKSGVAEPRILFTTYTNALVRFSEQLLSSLLGDDAKFVAVRTADSVALGIAREGGNQYKFASPAQLQAALTAALAKAKFEGNSLQKQSQRKTVEKLGLAYLLDEILGVIDARRITTLEAYEKAPRPGRLLALRKPQRAAVWTVREAFHTELAKAGVVSWEQIRGDAAERVEQGLTAESYDAVVVDEAQDLQPVVLQLLTGLCKDPSRLFLTADANQSIYGGAFRWQSVHDKLRFTGRTAVLVANHRSTREIGEAAHAYLSDGELDEDRKEREYVHAGPLPAVRSITNVEDQTRLLERFTRAACQELRLGVGAAAVLVPTERAGKELASALEGRGIPARFMSGRELDLRAKVVKVITLKSAKGLEFPVVAVAGFQGNGYPPISRDATEEECAEVMTRERRTLFVAMTRAMRALLVVRPAASKLSLLSGFDGSLWNLGAAEN